MKSQKSIEMWFKSTNRKKCGWEIRSNVIDNYDRWCDSPVNTKEEKDLVIDLVISTSLLCSTLGINIEEQVTTRLQELSEKGAKKYD